MAKAATKPKANKGSKAAPTKDVDALPDFDPYAMLDADLDGVEKQFDMASMSFDPNEPRHSTGLLDLDMILQGGLLSGGWYTCAGGEQSCKSTLAQKLLCTVVAKHFRGLSAYFDYEGSFSSEYCGNMMRYAGVSATEDEIFGLRDDAGNWLVKPRCRYYAPIIGEDFFSYMAKLQKILPDKIQKGGRYWFVYDFTRENQVKLKGKYDKKMFAKFKKFYVPAPDGSIQALVLTDSYPSMLPRAADGKDDGDQSIGLQARMFSKGLQRIKGDMRRKRIVVLGINQLRDKPMAHVPTMIEPCGQALMFYSDVRFRNSSISIPHGKGMLEEEESVVADGNDVYRYIKIKTWKNKLGGTPGQEVITRIIHEGADGIAKGFCRTWDLYNYLKNTGQISGNRNKFRFIDGFDYTVTDKNTGKRNEKTAKIVSPMVGIQVTWLEFKMLVEGHKDDVKSLCNKLGMKKAGMIRNFYEKQSAAGTGLQLFNAWRSAKNAKKAKKAKEIDLSDDDE